MLLYHEKQVGALCGVHCLNTLLQGPYFNEVDLAHIAQELDAAERAVLEEALQGPGNLDESGMFSIQVLSQALSIWNLQAIPYDNSELRAEPGFDPLKETAYICNLQEHWFTIRKVEGAWWNFNSIGPAPEALSDFYLAAFLDSLKEQGYTIFVVRGPVPASRGAEGTDLGGAGKWFTPEEAAAAQQEAAAARHRGRAQHAVEAALERAAQAGGALTLRSGRQVAGAGPSSMEEDDPELAAAIAASLQDAGGAGRGPTGPSYAAIAAAAAAAGGAGHHHTGSDGPPSVDGSWQMVGGEDEEDPELAQALALSMEEAQRAAGSQQQTRGTPPPGSSSSRQATPAAEQQQQAGASSGAAGTPPPPAPQVSVPEEPPEGGQGVLSLALRLPSGQRCCRRFLSLHTVGEVAAYAAQEAGLAGSQRVSLSTAFPVQVLSDHAATLESAGITDRSMLTVRPA